MAKKKEPIGWFTMNGRHVPLYEGESKADAISRATKESVKKQQENIKKNDAQKEAAIKEAYEKQKSFKDTTYEVMEKDGKYVVVGGNNNGSADPGSWHAKKNDYRERGYKELPDSDYENFRNSLKKGSLSDSSSGKASDEAREKYDLKNPPKNTSSEAYEKWYQYAENNLTAWQKANNHQDFVIPGSPDTPMYDKSFRTELRKKEPGFKGKGIPQIVNKLKSMSYDERGKLYEKYTGITHVPASFEKQYPNLSYTELKKKYEEFLKKNRK